MRHLLMTLVLSGLAWAAPPVVTVPKEIAGDVGDYQLIASNLPEICGKMTTAERAGHTTPPSKHTNLVGGRHVYRSVYHTAAWQRVRGHDGEEVRSPNCGRDGTHPREQANGIQAAREEGGKVAVPVLVRQGVRS